MSLKPWFQEANRRIAEVEAVRNMTRQEALIKGYLTVKDMDDEELRAGMCRNPDGKIPKVAGKTQTIPKDLYDDMIAEHEARWKQNLRERLDIMTEVIVGVALDDTAEPRDRMEAAKYIIERVAGKPTERVNVTVEKAPWEEMLNGIAAGVTREQSRAMRGLTIDEQGNEVSGSQDGEVGTGVDVSQMVQIPGSEPSVDQFQPDPRGAGPEQIESARGTGEVDGGQTGVPWYADAGRYGYGVDERSQSGRGQDVEAAASGSDRGPDSPVQGEHAGPDSTRDVPEIDVTVPQFYVPADSAYQPAEPVPSHDNLANSSSTMEADLLKAQQDLVERRKLAKDRIQAAKKARKIARALGTDVYGDKDFAADDSEVEQTGEGTIRFNLEDNGRD